MSYRTVCLVAVALFAALGVMLVFAPHVAYWLFAVEGHPTADFLTRRIGAVFAGLAVLTYMLGQETSAATQKAVSMGMIALMLPVAAMGVYELVTGTAGAGILLASLTEVGFALAFWRVAKAL